MRFEVDISKEGVDKLLDCIIKNKLEYDRIYIHGLDNNINIKSGSLTAKAGDFGIPVVERSL